MSHRKWVTGLLSAGGRSLAVVSASLVLASVFTLGTQAPGSATTVKSSSVRESSSTCTTLEGVDLTVGSKDITTTTHLAYGDDNDPVYGVPIPAGTIVVSVFGSSKALLSHPSMLTETGATLTMCPKGSGSITCTSISGTWRFTPGLITTPQTVTIHQYLTVSGCTTTAPANGAIERVAVPHAVDSNAWKSSVSGVNLSCGSFQTGTDFVDSSGTTTGKLTWSDPLAGASSFNFSGFAINAPSGTDNISFPNPGGTSAVTGAYMGSATATFTTNPNLTLSAKCKTVAGVRSIEIQGGTFTLG